MLDFLDKDFKTAVITILWQVRENILEMNEKREFLWKVIKAIKWNKWKKPITENTVIVIKIHWRDSMSWISELRWQKKE